MDNSIHSVGFNLANARILLLLFFNQCCFEKQMGFDFDLQHHNHPYHEIFFVKRGRLIVKIESKDYSLQSNSFIIVPAGTSHVGFWKSENSQVLCMSCEFYKNNKKNTKTDIFGLLNKLISRNNKPHIFRKCSQIIYKFELLVNASKNVNAPLYEEYLNHIAIIFAIDLIYFMNSAITVPLLSGGASDNLNDDNIFAKKRSYTNIIDDYINDSSREKISLSELTEILHLSKNQTIKLIKQIYNANFSDIIINTRMNTAKSMIQNTNLTFESIAEQVGYTYNGFLRAFKKATGKTPSQFRRERI